MRLVLSATALIASWLGMPGLIFTSPYGLGLIAAYFSYSVLVLLPTPVQRFLEENPRYPHWIDLIWYVLLVAMIDQHGGIFFLFLFFVVFSASFRFGYREGIRVTCAATLSYFLIETAYGSFTAQGSHWGPALLRTAFLACLGYLLARWGESENNLKKRLDLLREVSQLSNPRFGVDRTVSAVMEKIRDYFQANSCLIVELDPRSEQYTVRNAPKGDHTSALHTKAIPGDIGETLLLLGDWDAGALVRNQKCFPEGWRDRQIGHFHDSQSDRWSKLVTLQMEAAADVLSCNCYLTAPLPGKRRLGRIYICLDNVRQPRESALFLLQVAKYAFSTIDNIEMLDRLATEAAHQERRKLGRDLHDSTLQPYIGLKLGLEALLEQDADAAALRRGVDQLRCMTVNVIHDLQTYIAGIRTDRESAEAVLLANLKRQIAHFEAFYGIRIAIKNAAKVALNDRLAAEVLHIINEGLSNIRKHTDAQRGVVALEDRNGILGIRIENEALQPVARQFIPRSITERAVSLGGRAWVETGKSERTVLHVEIPL